VWNLVPAGPELLGDGDDGGCHPGNIALGCAPKAAIELSAHWYFRVVEREEERFLVRGPAGETLAASREGVLVGAALNEKYPFSERRVVFGPHAVILSSLSATSRKRSRA
jgi:hypothetical protein